MRVHDAFIVRYDAVNDQSLSLPEHCDTSSMSIIFALNEEDKTDNYCQNNDNYGQNYESQHSSQQHQQPQSQPPSRPRSQRNRGEERDYLRGSGLRDYKGGGTWFEALDQNSSSRSGSNSSSSSHSHSGSGFSSSSIPSSGSSSSSGSGSEFSSRVGTGTGTGTRILIQGFEPCSSTFIISYPTFS